MSAELGPARAELAEAALARARGPRRAPPPSTGAISFDAARAAWAPSRRPQRAPRQARLGLAALRRQRERLEELRALRRVGPEAFLILQEELDFLEVTLSDEEDRRIEQS